MFQTFVLTFAIKYQKECLYMKHSWGITFLCIDFMLLKELTTLNLHNRDNQHSTLMWSFIRGLKLAFVCTGRGEIVA